MIYVGVILYLSPYLPDIVAGIRKKVSSERLYWGTIVVEAVFLLFLFIYFVKSFKGAFRLFPIFPLVIFVVFFLYLKNPVEHIHLFEYGVLGLALSLWKIGSINLRVLSIGFIVGLVDELYQGYLPNRVFDYHDLLINFVGVAINGKTGSLLRY